MATSHVSKRVGVFGGTFDPVHNGHVAVASAVLEALQLDQVLFAVTSDQWLRDSPPEASSTDRLRMVELAVEHVEEFAASDVDIVREGSTYTVDTLRDLRLLLGETVELFLILGADSALSMDRWKDAIRIAEMATIVVVGRPGEHFELESLSEEHPVSGAEYVEGPMIDVSATGVRGFVRTRKSVDGLIAETVAEYVGQRNLYR
jgi:nicotinate-nucleotide adenylyltransferase